MTKPAEITEESLKLRIRKALQGGVYSGNEPDVDRLYEVGGFSELVGVVEKATTEERNRAAATCRRLGHAQTARVIQKGN